MSKSVFCLSENESQAERIVQELKAAGFSNNDISVLFPTNRERRILLTNSTPRHRRGPLQEQAPAEC